MDTQALNDLAIQKTVEKFEKQQDRVIRQTGAQATDGGLAITQSCFMELADHIRLAVGAYDYTPQEAKFVALIRNLAPEVLALCIVQTTLSCLAHGLNMRDTLLAIGTAVAQECWAAKLTVDNPRLAARIAKNVSKKHSSAKRRASVATAIAANEGYKQRKWTGPATLTAGNWCMNVLRHVLPHVFVINANDEGTSVHLTEQAQDWAEKAIVETIKRNPVYLPMVEPPRPWTGFRRGGPIDERQNPLLVRTVHKQTEAAVKAAVRSGQMQPALDGLNALQATPFRINTPVLDVIKWCWDSKLKVKGLPPRDNLKTSGFVPEGLDEAQQRLWRKRNNDIKVRNLGFIGDRLLFKEDMETAALMAEHDRFWTPMNLDWRTRVYGLPFFNFQREDRVRALFLFADGEPIGEEGLRWLKIHVANCGDFNKISKRTMEERVAWVDSFMGKINFIALHPTSELAREVWTKADKPFLFLAACLELARCAHALAAGDVPITRLPVSFDGSCSGLQHLCAMTRAPEGHLVNLTDNLVPADVYQTTADAVVARLLGDKAIGFITVKTKDGEKQVNVGEMATTWLDFGVDRKVVKRNVMTYAYSSKKFGMAAQQEEDLMVPLRFEVMEGKRQEHPFGDNEMTQKAAARYLAGHVYAEIERVVPGPASAMAMLQKCAKALAHEGKPLTWVTPAGAPWINRYHEPKTTRVTLWLQDRGVKVQHRVLMAVDFQPEIDKEKAASGVAPNFVHALDASHLLLTARRAAAEGITSLATVHDSFGCLASRAGAFNRIIREEFVRMYTDHDVLTEVLEQARRDLTQANWNRLPDVPVFGALNINDVMEAKYAFA